MVNCVVNSYSQFMHHFVNLIHNCNFVYGSHTGCHTQGAAILHLRSINPENPKAVPVTTAPSALMSSYPNCQKRYLLPRTFWGVRKKCFLSSEQARELLAQLSARELQAKLQPAPCCLIRCSAFALCCQWYTMGSVPLHVTTLAKSGSCYHCTPNVSELPKIACPKYRPVPSFTILKKHYIL